MSNVTSAHLRQRILATRDELAPDVVLENSREVQARVLNLEEFRTALRVGLYAAFQNEIRTEQLFIEGDRHRKEIYFPAVDEECGGLAYFRVKTLEDLLLTAQGFREPSAKQSRLRDLNTLNVVIVPGIAFDVEGRRMGFGKGFYDDCLKQFRGKRIALAYDFQVVAALPHGFKRAVDWIVTNKRVIRCC
jgi:5-formyltetrahydrofolate cyclo-ligase